MRWSPTRTSLLLMATVCAFLSGGTSLGAAGPRLILISGGGLERPIVLSDWQENMSFLQQLTTPQGPEPRQLAARPFLNVSLFWGPQWDEYLRDGRPLSELRPEQANQHGRFYPAVSGAAAATVAGGCGAVTAGVSS